MSSFEYRSLKNRSVAISYRSIGYWFFLFVQNADLGADAAYKLFESQISQVINRHAPIKQAYQRKKKLTCMNSSLKRAIFLKNIFIRDYVNNRYAKTWKKLCQYTKDKIS